MPRPVPMIATRHLPLFPLPVVLFPGTLLPLHIFEARYRQMVAHCLESDKRFGLVYHDPDRHGPFLAEEGRVGCIAEIIRFQPLQDGRSLIVSRGERRFRLAGEVDSTAMYYEAAVETFDDTTQPHEWLRQRRAGSVALFREAAARLAEGGASPPLPEIDMDRDASFQLAEVIQIDPAWQQTLLAIDSEEGRLDYLDRLLRQVIQEEAG